MKHVQIWFVGCLGAMTLSTGVGWGQAQFDTGFYSATGNAAQTVKDGWLENGCASGEPYVQGDYHIGADFGRAYGLPVYAIWDGTVIQISTNGWGAGNVAVIVKSKLDNGQEFLWLLGHVQAGSTPNPGATVKKGTQVALIGHWSLGDHVHVGILPGTTLPSTDSGRMIGWGLMGCANWSDASKFLGSFGVNVSWSPPWELRWGAMSFTNNSSILMYHATNTNDPSQRLLWDPDRSAWPAAAGPVDSVSRDEQAKQDMLDRSLTDDRFTGRPNVNGFTNPLAWLTAQIPSDPSNTQAKTDCAKRALSDSRFIGSGQGFYVNVNWDVTWELRGVDFLFIGNRTVRIYQITSKADPSVRYTGFSDPTQNNLWTGWVRV